MESYAIRFSSCNDFRREKVEEGRNAIILIYMYIYIYIYTHIHPWMTIKRVYNFFEILFENTQVCA